MSHLKTWTSVVPIKNKKCQCHFEKKRSKMSFYEFPVSYKFVQILSTKYFSW